MTPRYNGFPALLNIKRRRRALNVNVYPKCPEDFDFVAEPCAAHQMKVKLKATEATGSREARRQTDQGWQRDRRVSND